MLFGKLSPGGVLTNISDRAALTYGDGSTDVQLVAMPAGLGPFGYDVANKLATTLVAVSLLALTTSLNALSATQKNAIWADVTSGNPPKWSKDVGANAAAIAVLQLLTTSGTLNAADILAAKIRGVAMYVQDNPNYLVNPAFDPSINVPGLA